jgi:hypothetical protein
LANPSPVKTARVFRPSGRVRRAPRPAAREAEGLAAAGATLVSASTNDYGEYCVNMLDPEGNEFDVL